ncbi:MAG: ATP-binding protein [Candidatus Gastranaerophilaceae bacterium]
MIKIYPKTVIPQPKNQNVKLNSNSSVNYTNKLDKDVFSPSFCSKLELPVEEIEKLGQKYIKFLNDKITIPEKKALLGNYFIEVTDANLRASKGFKNESNFIKDFGHELTGSYVFSQQLRMEDLDEIVPIESQHKVADDCIKKVIVHYNKVLKMYQYFLDNNLVSETSTIGINNVFKLVIEAFEDQAKDKNIKLKVKGLHLLNKCSDPKEGPFADYQNYILMSNFLSNSLKYSYENSVVIMEFKLKNNDLHFIIKDEGRGIPEKEHSDVLHQKRASNVKDIISGKGWGLYRNSTILEKAGYEKIKITSPLYPNAPQRKGTMMECPLILNTNQKNSDSKTFIDRLRNFLNN